MVERKPQVTSRWVKAVDLGPSPDATEFVPILRELIKEFGMPNVRLYINEMQNKDGYSYHTIKAHCYADPPVSSLAR
jgi:hypothetical protein